MRISRIIGLLALLLPAYIRAQTVIQNVTYGTTAPVVVSGSSTVVASTNVNVPADATVVYQASTSITLQPGFHALPSSKFFALPGASVDTDGDGLPDAWEHAYGLNANNAADASHLALAGGGLTYLQMYQAALYPMQIAPGAVQNAGLPSGIELIIRTPANRFYGVDTDTYQISSVPTPP